MTSTLDDLKRSLSMRDLLARHGFQVRGRTVRCPSGSHPDKHPSASIYVAPSDGDERVRCHRCQFDEDVVGVARVLGEYVPGWSGTARRRAGHVLKPNYRIRALGRLLEQRPEWAFEWEAAKLLAQLDPIQARADVVANWDYLSERGDIPLILQTAYMIRGVAILSFCDAKSIERPGAVGYAVRRLLDQVGR